MTTFLTWWIASPLRLALSAMAAGGAMGLTVAFGVMAINAIESQNYRHIGFLGDIVVGLIGGMAGFWLGVYLLVGALWLWQDEDRGPSPGLTATATVLGLAIGSSVTTLVMPLIYQPLFAVSPGLAATVSSGVYFLGGLGAAVGAAMLALGVRWPKYRRRAYRAVHLAVPTLAILVGLGFAATPRTDFPGGEAPIAERRAWAAKTFGVRYEDSETFLEQHAGVRSAIGPVKAVGPVPGPNRTSTSPGEMMGTFTLQVVGEKGEGVAHLEFFHGNHQTGVESYSFKGRFLHQGPAVSLQQASKNGI